MSSVRLGTEKANPPLNTGAPKKMGQDPDGRVKSWLAQRRGATHWDDLISALKLQAGLDDLAIRHMVTELIHQQSSEVSDDFVLPENFPFNSPAASKFVSMDTVHDLLQQHREKYQSYMDGYLALYQSSFPIISTAVFSSMAEKYWNDPRSADEAWLASFLMVLALGCFAATRDQRSAMELCMAAEACLGKTSFMVQPDILVVRTLCLMVLAKQSLNATCRTFDSCWTLLGIVTRAATAINLHKQPMPHHELQADVGVWQSEQALWSTVVYFCIQVAMVTGKPLLVSADLFAERLPLSISQTSNPWVVLIDVYPSMYQIISRISSSTDKPLYDEVVKYNDYVRQLMDALMSNVHAQIYPNLAKTSLAGYNGISPGPTFRVRRGRQSVVRVVNQNDRPAVLHLHGSHSRAVWDGWAEDLIQPGQYKDYYFPNSHTARTLWYHGDHANMITSVNLFSGLAGFYIIEDPEVEAQLGLPQDKYDIPLALNSKQYTPTGSLISVANETESTYGDVIEVNGQPWPFLAVEPRKYRFRILNSSLSRTFNITIVDNSSGNYLPLGIVASDSGFLSSSVTTTNLLIAMAERWEVIIDFSSFENQNLTVTNGKNIFDSTDFPHTDLVMQFTVGSTVSSDANNNSPPSSLVPIDTPPTSLVNRKFKNDEWVINGVPFSDVKNRVLAAPQRGATEIWVLENQNPWWSHPIHIHLVNFQILSRSGGRNTVEPFEKVALKDVALLGPRETVTIAVIFAPFVGVYMFHCHNAIHEDHAMMDAFNITAVQGLGYNVSDLMFADPLNATWRAKDYPDLNTQANIPAAGTQGLITAPVSTRNNELTTCAQLRMDGNCGSSAGGLPEASAGSSAHDQPLHQGERAEARPELASRNDNHIIQAIATVDFQDKGVNGFFMRLREWSSIGHQFHPQFYTRSSEVAAAAVVAIYVTMPATVTRHTSINILATPDITDGSPEGIIHMKYTNAMFSLKHQP
ncbi:hypothetical protein MKX08_003441 [Trichoderma sp. CBMAI-0020]|nr:hypothetical protein MKX08_003441 [Trichoderma sp. CBMAI-0020]